MFLRAGHQKQVERAVFAAGLGEVVSFTGPVGRQMKKSAFFDADLFVLPTHSESFGIVVAEALAHDLPVLTTTRAPWSLLPLSGCGWWVDATVDGIAEGLREATILDSETLHAMGAKGHALVIAEFAWKRVANLVLTMYQGILANTGQLQRHPLTSCARNYRRAPINFCTRSSREPVDAYTQNSDYLRGQPVYFVSFVAGQQ